MITEGGPRRESPPRVRRWATLDGFTQNKHRREGIDTRVVARIGLASATPRLSGRRTGRSVAVVVHGARWRLCCAKPQVSRSLVSFAPFHDDRINAKNKSMKVGLATCANWSTRRVPGYVAVSGTVASRYSTRRNRAVG